MRAPSCVLRVARTSSSPTLSGRRRNQSPPPGRSSPFRRGPSNVPERTLKIWRLPWGVWPIIWGGSSWTVMSNRCWKRGSSMVDLLSFGVLPDGGLEALQVTVDGVGGAAAVGQGCHHKVGAVDVVAAGEHAAAAGAVVVADSNQVAALVRVQAGRGLL